MEMAYGYFPILRERATQDAGLLSGGQQQMLAISRALMAAPELMLLDEPSLGLSPKLTREIFEIVVRINRERGTTMLLVEQNANMALNVADHGYVLESGRIVMEDSCERLREKDDIKEFYLGMKDSRRARRAALEEEEDLAMSEPHGTSTHLQPRTDVVVPGETMPAMFWNAVAMRERRILMRQKELGIWRAMDLGRRPPSAVREIGDGLVSLGFAARRVRLDPGQHRWSNGCWPTWPSSVAGGVCNGIYPTDAAAAGRSTCAATRARVYLFVEDDEQLDKFARGARAAAAAAQGHRLRHGRPARLRATRDVIEPGSSCASWAASMPKAHPAAAGRAHRRAASPRTWRSWSTPRAPPASPRARCTQPRRPDLHCAGPATALSRRTRRDERMCFLPLCHIAERMGGEYFALYTGAVLNFVENPETVPENVREIAPHRVHRRAARVGEVLLGSGDRAARGRQAAADWPMAGRIGVGSRVAAHACSSASPSAGWLKLQLPAGALAGAGQRAQA